MALIGPFNFAKGLDSNRNNLASREGVITTLQDWDIDSGAITSRRGSFLVKDFGTSGTKINGLTYWYDAANSTDVLVASWNGALETAPYSGDSATLTWTDRTGATTDDSTGANMKSWDVLNNILIMVGGSQTSQVALKLTAYNGNFANLGGSPPQANIVKVVNNFAFLSGNISSTAVRSRVYWSNLADPETWTAANNLDFRKNDGDNITALSSFGQDLIIFKQKSIGRLSTNTVSTSGAVTLGPLTTVSERVGCAGPLAVDKLSDGSVIFLGNDANIYVYDGLSPRNITNQYGNGPIKNFLNSNTHPINLYYAVLKYYLTKDQVYLFTSTGSSTTSGNTKCLVYNLYQNNFQEHTGHTLMTAITLPSTRSGPTAGFPEVLLGASQNAGSTQRSIFDLDSPSISYATNDGNVAVVNPTFTYEWTLEGDLSNFTPRCMVMFCKVTGTYSSFDYQFYINGTALGSAVTSVTDFTSGASRRLVMPIPYAGESTFVRGAVLKVVCTFKPTTGSMTIGNIYLSDEIPT